MPMHFNMFFVHICLYIEQRSGISLQAFSLLWVFFTLRFYIYVFLSHIFRKCSKKYPENFTKRSKMKAVKKKKRNGVNFSEAAGSQMTSPVAKSHSQRKCQRTRVCVIPAACVYFCVHFWAGETSRGGLKGDTGLEDVVFVVRGAPSGSLSLSGRDGQMDGQPQWERRWSNTPRAQGFADNGGQAKTEPFKSLVSHWHTTPGPPGGEVSEKCHFLVFFTVTVHDKPSKAKKKTTNKCSN